MSAQAANIQLDECNYRSAFVRKVKRGVKVIMLGSIRLLFAHIVLLILASTSFTAITGLRDGHFQWEYFRYASQSGWGTLYQFPYTLPVVLTYLAAYATGLATYTIIWRRGSWIIGATGVVLCGIGFASFAYELTHWFSEHYDSWIASVPAALLLLAVAAVFQQYRLKAVSHVGN